MKEESETGCPGARAGRLGRNGKIGRLPRAVRDELNQRLLDGETGKALVQWLHELPEARAALQREFGGRAVTEQNLSEWKQGGFRDWVAKTEADELMADTLGDGRESQGEGGKAGEMETVSDKVAGWFFPYYVAAARGQLTAAQTPAERWSVLRMICADLAGLRRSDHYVERLRLWREKLRLETEEEQKITEEEVVEWVRANPDIEQKIWPDRECLTHEEKEECMRQILGISKSFRKVQTSNADSGTTVEEKAVVEGDPGDASSEVKNPT